MISNLCFYYVIDNQWQCKVRNKICLGANIQHKVQAFEMKWTQQLPLKLFVIPLERIMFLLLPVPLPLHHSTCNLNLMDSRFWWLFEIVLEYSPPCLGCRDEGRGGGRLGEEKRVLTETGSATLLVKTNFEVYLGAKLNFVVRSYRESLKQILKIYPFISQS